MRSTLAAFFVALTILTAPSALAAPTQVNVRIEGKTETLFEGPILTDGHQVKALSDSVARRCDGLNNGANPIPGPTPTAAAVDAMRIVGGAFDGNWFGEYDDYFVTQWGPDRQDAMTFAYWGIAVNNVFTNVGGCQYQLTDGDEVLWVYDAFNGRERLGLDPAGYSGGAVPGPATAQLDQPFTVEVNTWAAYDEGTPPPAPERSTAPYEGATVAPVLTASNGFQRIDSDSPAAVLTGADGEATITFTTPGWHRIKATDFAAGGESVVRSNRLDVCVPEPPNSGCGAPPADAQLRIPPPLEDDGDPPGVDPPPTDPGPGEPTPPQPQPPPRPQPPAVADPIRVALKRLDRSRARQGLVGVSWRVLDPGVGVRRWTVAAKKLGSKGARFVNRARGTTRTSARVRLAPGARYRLKLTFTDLLGRQSSAQLGTVRIPRRG